MTLAKIHERGGPKKLTPTQQAKAELLVDRGIYVYPNKGTGKAVISSFRRFLETSDPEKLSKPLYQFLIMRAGGFIAHYDLQGFRSLYAEPADLLDRKCDHGGAMFGGSAYDGPTEHDAYVFTDGLTDKDVWAKMRELAVAHRGRLERERAGRARDADLAKARALAAKHGMSLA